MKLKPIFTLVIVAGLGVGGWYYFKKDDPAKAASPVFEYAEIKRAKIQNLVSATGTLAARELIEIGTQVSGTIVAVNSDFNKTVTANQLLAQIDTSVLDANVMSAEADLARSQANLARAQADYDRFKPVRDKGFLSEDAFLNYEIALKNSQASELSSQANLRKSQINRKYADIRSPIDGIVIDRNAEVGQTVAASLNTPRLFTIAQDLDSMEILANVDESDIGQIKEGQDVRFTVAAYSEDNFEGVVTEIRLQPSVIQNVVNYTVVIQAQNKRGRLLPGMTATVDFVVAEVEDVLSVPAAALNLRPNEEMRAAMAALRSERGGGQGGQGGQGRGEGGERRRPEGGGQGGGFGGGGFGGGGGGFGGGMGGGGRAAMGTLWYQDENGDLKIRMVRKGVSDGITTEVIALRDPVEEGMKIISKVNDPAAATATPRPQGGFGGPGGGGSMRRLGL